MRIIRLELFARNLEAQARFYAEKLGLPVSRDLDGQVTIQAGETELIFKKAGPDFAGFVHLAFNIPENKLDDAHAWLDARTTLIPNKNWQEIFFFERWNTHAMYCYDAAGNILEFAARHNLKNPSAEAFGSAHILCVSEIGLTTDDVLAQTSRFISKMGLSSFQETVNNNFVALGDEHGLVLLARKGREWYPNTGKYATFTPVKMRVDVNGRAFEVEACEKRGLFGGRSEEIEIRPLK